MAVERALISVFDKTGIVEFRETACGVEDRNSIDGRNIEAVARSERRGARCIGFHRLAGDAGRPREDAASEGTRRICSIAANTKTIRRRRRNTESRRSISSS